MLSVNSACGCNMGKKRKNNEDNFYFDGIILDQENDGMNEIFYTNKDLSSPFCCGVFDGMGGFEYGEVAAYIAANEMRKQVEDNTDIPQIAKNVMFNANRKICNAMNDFESEFMGSTAAILSLYDNKAYIGNIGDSRIYIIRDDYIKQLSEDHTERKLLAEYGVENVKPRLTQHLGMKEGGFLFEPYLNEFKILSGDKILLCSDGLTDMISEEDIKTILTISDTAEKSVETLIRTALVNGGKDNITVIANYVK